MRIGIRLTILADQINPERIGWITCGTEGNGKAIVLGRAGRHIACRDDSATDVGQQSQAKQKLPNSDFAKNETGTQSAHAEKYITKVVAD